MSASKILRYVISLLLAAVLLYFSFRGVDWEAFLEDLSLCSWHFIALSMLLSVAAFFFRSQRWKCLIRPIDPTIDSLSTFNGVCIGYVANFVFPRLGELVRCGFIHRRSAKRHPDDPQHVATFDKTLGTVLMSRSWDVAMVFLLMGVLLAFRWSLFGDFFTKKMFSPLSGSLSSLPLWAYIAALSLVAALIYVMIRRGGSRIGKFCRGIADGFASWVRMPRKWEFFVYTVLLWATYSLMSYCIILSMPQLSTGSVTLGAVDALFVSVAGSFAWMVPVPGGFGAYHYVVALALSSVYGLAWDDGIMCATLNHESQAVTMLVCGIITYLIETFRKK